MIPLHQPWHLNIFATHEERQETATGPWPGDHILGVALPCTRAIRKKIRIRHGLLECVATILDIGPWCIDDALYVLDGQRPRAELLKGKPCPTWIGGPAVASVPNGNGGMKIAPISNGAGIDLYPGTARALGIPIGENAFVDWCFEI